MSTSELSREEWLEERKKGVGASEAGAIFGVSPWATALQLYFAKLGLYEVESTPLMQWGLRIEPVIADAYSELTGRKVAIPRKLMRHAKAPWMLASLDRIADDRVVEIKRVTSFAAKEWGDSGSADVPYHYFLQVQQQMAVADLGAADIAALIGDCDFRVYSIARDEAIIERLIEAERDFMRRVAEQDPPMPDWEHPSTADILAMIEPITGESKELDADLTNIVEEYEQLGKVKKSVETERDGLKARLLHAMGTAEIGYLADGRHITRKVIERKGFTVEATSYVDLRIKSPKSKKVSAA